MHKGTQTVNASRARNTISNCLEKGSTEIARRKTSGMPFHIEHDFHFNRVQFRLDNNSMRV